MNILYASDDNYAEIAGVSILSLFENNKDADEINVYIINDNISEQNISMLKKVQNDYKRKIFFLDAPDIEKIANTALVMQARHWPLVAFSRLFITSLLPADMERIIYLDCDTLICGSLNRLWDFNQCKNVISGVADPIDPRVNKRLMLKAGDFTVNSGVLFINLNLWRAFRVEEKFVKYIQFMEGRFLYPDQDVLNSVLRGYIGKIDPTYNCRPANTVLKECPEASSIDRARIPDMLDGYVIIENPIIIHYYGWYGRPWEVDNPEVEFLREVFIIWRKYKSMSPWKNAPLRKPSLPADTASKLKNSKYYRYYRKLKPLITPFFAIKRKIANISKRNKDNSLKQRQAASGLSIEDCRISDEQFLQIQQEQV